MHELPTGAAGMIVLTFCDHEHDRFVPLAACRFVRPAALEAAWQSIPELSGGNAFLAGRHEAVGAPVRGSNDALRRTLTALIVDRRGIGTPLAG